MVLPGYKAINLVVVMKPAAENRDAVWAYIASQQNGRIIKSRSGYEGPTVVIPYKEWELTISTNRSDTDTLYSAVFTIVADKRTHSMVNSHSDVGCSPELAHMHDFFAQPAFNSLLRSLEPNHNLSLTYDALSRCAKIQLRKTGLVSSVARIRQDTDFLKGTLDMLVSKGFALTSPPPEPFSASEGIRDYNNTDLQPLLMDGEHVLYMKRPDTNVSISRRGMQYAIAIVFIGGFFWQALAFLLHQNLAMQGSPTPLSTSTYRTFMPGEHSYRALCVLLKRQQSQYSQAAYAILRRAHNTTPRA